MWLLPPAGSDIGSKLESLIKKTLPNLFPNVQLPIFPPHITITSDVDPALDPVAVTSAIEVSSTPEVKFTTVDIGKTFFTRVTLHLEKTDSIVTLATECRKRYVTNGNLDEAKKWAEESFVPHLSLVYMESVPEPGEVKRIEEEVAKAGIKFDVEAWKGGRIVLVRISECECGDEACCTLSSLI